MSVMVRMFIIESRRLVILLNHKKESLFISGFFKILQKVDYFCIIFELWVFIKKIILFFLFNFSDILYSYQSREAKIYIITKSKDTYDFWAYHLQI